MMIDVRVGYYIGHITHEEVFLVDTDRESLFSSLRQRFPDGKRNGVSYTVRIGDYGGFTVTVMERLPIPAKDFMDFLFYYLTYILIYGIILIKKEGYV